MGHTISGDGVKVDQAKIRAIADWHEPSTIITELRGFLCLIGYYRNFVKDYGVIARPLTNMVKKDTSEWTDRAKIAFGNLKSAMTTTLTLALLDSLFLLLSRQMLSVRIFEQFWHNMADR